MSPILDGMGGVGTLNTKIVVSNPNQPVFGRINKVVIDVTKVGPQGPPGPPGDVSLSNNNDWTGNQFFTSGIPWYGIKPSGDATGVQDVTALNLAETAASTAGGGIIYMYPGNWYINDPVVLGSGVALQGAGSSQTVAKTNITCVSSDAQIAFGTNLAGSDPGAENFGFKVDGNGIADLPLYIGARNGAIFRNIDITDGVVANYALDATQNCQFTEFNSLISAGDIMWIDRGASGNHFTKCEYGVPGRYHIDFRATAATFFTAYPQRNVWDGSCIFEYTTATGGPLINHAAGLGNIISNCHMVVTDDFDMTPDVPCMIRTSQGFAPSPSQLILHNCSISSNDSRPGLWAIDVESNSSVVLTGMNAFGGMGTIFNVIDATSLVHVAGKVLADGVNWATGPVGAAQAVIQTQMYNPMVFTRPAAEIALTMQVDGDNFARLVQYAVGVLAWGPGNATQDVSIGYGGAQTLSVTGRLTVSDYLAVTGNFGANGATPVGKQTLGAAATDPASTQTLANNLRSALIALGLGQT